MLLKKYKQYFLRITQGALLVSLFMPLLVAMRSLVFPFVTAKVWFFCVFVLLAAVS